MAIILRQYWHLAVIGLLLIAYAWLWHDNGRLTTQRDLARVEKATLIHAGKAAERAQIAANLGKELTYAHKALESERTHSAQLADVRGATDRFIAAQRLHRPQSSGRPGPSGTPAQGGGAGVAPDMPASAFVVIRDDDVQRCAAAAAYALNAHVWARDTFTQL